MNSTGFAAFAALTQATMEACYGVTLVIGGNSIAAARGPWRNAGPYEGETDSIKEDREVTVRVLKASLTALTITILPGFTAVTVGSTRCIVTDVAAGSTDPAFRLTCRATAPAAAQT